MGAVNIVDILGDLRNGDARYIHRRLTAELGGGQGEVRRFRKDKAVLEHLIGHIDGEKATQFRHRGNQEKQQQGRRRQTQCRPQAAPVEHPQQKAAAALVEVKPLLSGVQLEGGLVLNAPAAQLLAQGLAPLPDLLDLVLGQRHTGPGLLKGPLVPTLGGELRLFRLRLCLLAGGLLRSGLLGRLLQLVRYVVKWPCHGRPPLLFRLRMLRRERVASPVGAMLLLFVPHAAGPTDPQRVRSPGIIFHFARAADRKRQKAHISP